MRFSIAFRCTLTQGYCYCSDVFADVNLYIPGTAEQPVSAEPLGTGPNGVTTWKLLPGKPTGTWTQSGFPLTGARFRPSDRNDKTNPTPATLVSGPSNVVLQYTDDPISVTYSCAINGGNANCNAVWIDPTGTYSRSIKETARPFRVQAVDNPGATPPPTPGSNQSPGTPTDAGRAAVQSNAAGSFEHGSIVGGVLAVLMGVWLM